MLLEGEMTYLNPVPTCGRHIKYGIMRQIGQSRQYFAHRHAKEGGSLRTCNRLLVFILA